MLERIEIKKLVKEAVSRDPPLKWYLYHMCIYGRFISKLTDYVSRFCLRKVKSYETLINNIISDCAPVNYIKHYQNGRKRHYFADQRR